MKSALIYIAFLFPIISPTYAQEIVQKDGLFYNSSNELYTGKYKEFFDNQKIKVTAQIKDGERVGLWLVYDEKGHLLAEREYSSE